MEYHYSHLTLKDRCEISRLHASGHSLRQIAATLERAPSTVSRELRRNASETQQYQPHYADQHAHARRWRGSMLDRNPALRKEVLKLLKRGWSPQQVAASLAQKYQQPIISYETIYRFIRGQNPVIPAKAGIQ